MTTSLPLPGDADDLRVRAARCRDYAREYASDVGCSLTDLAVEFDKRADRLDRKDQAHAAAPEEAISDNPAPQPAQ